MPFSGVYEKFSARLSIMITLFNSLPSLLISFKKIIIYYFTFVNVLLYIEQWLRYKRAFISLSESMRSIIQSN